MQKKVSCLFCEPCSTVLGQNIKRGFTMGVDSVVDPSKKTSVGGSLGFESSLISLDALDKPLIILPRDFIDRTEQIYRRVQQLQTAFQKAAAQPGRTGCAAISLSVGISHLLSGDIWTGGAITLIAASELKNVFCADENPDLRRLFNRMSADVEAIESLQKANTDSCTFVQGYLEKANAEVSSLHEQLKSISAIHEEGQMAIAEKKQKAVRLNQQATKAYEEALSFFDKTKKEITFSQQQYARCEAFFREIQEITTEENASRLSQDQVSVLFCAARDTCGACAEGKSSLDRSALHFSQALTKLQEASKLKEEASKAESEAVKIAEEAIASAGAQAVLKDTSLENIEAAQKEMKKIQERNGQITEILEELREDVLVARTEAEARWSMPEITLSVGTAVCLTAPSSFMGALGLMALAASTGYAYRNRAQITSAVCGIYRTVMGIPEAKLEPMKLDKPASIAFSNTSSGLWGHYIQGRSSTTVGTATLKLGKDEIMTLPFNLNDSKDPIDRLALLKLFGKLSTGLQERTLDVKECLEILHELESKKLNRGGSIQVGLIGTSRSAAIALSLLKEQCASQKNSEPEVLGA